MSKVIKQMEMDALKDTFKGIQDMVVLSASGLGCVTDNQVRLGLRKKGIRLQVVKNSLINKVFQEVGLHLPQRLQERDGKKTKTKGFWEGSTLISLGGDSLA